MDSNKSNLQTLLQEKQQQTEKLSININQLRVSLAVIDFKHCHKVEPIYDCEKQTQQYQAFYTFN